MGRTDDKTGWLLALGGAVVGFVVVRLSGRRYPSQNPGDFQMDLDGFVVFGRASGANDFPMDLYVIVHPDSDVVERLGRVERRLGGVYLAYPTSRYRTLGVDSILPEKIIEKGTDFRSVRASAKYLLDSYVRHKNLGVEVRRIHQEHVKRIVS